MNYQRKTDQEIRTLALDVLSGRVFGTWSHEDAARLSFMPLGLCGSEHIEAMQQAEIAHVYEYIEQAGPRSINGLPSFMSMKLLDKQDAQRLMAELKRAEAMQAAFMDGAQPVS